MIELSQILGGSGSLGKLPIGSVVEFANDYGTLIEADGKLFAKSGVPTRLIPNFSTNFTSIDDKTKPSESTPANLENVLLPTFASTASVTKVSPNGDMVRIVSSTNSNAFAIQRKLASETNFSAVQGVGFNPNSIPIASFAANHLILNNGDNWVILTINYTTTSFSTYIYSSQDNGLNWELANIISGLPTDTVSAETEYLIIDAALNSNNVLMLATNTRIYMSTNFGKSLSNVYSGSNIRSICDYGTSFAVLSVSTGTSVTIITTDNNFTSSNTGNVTQTINVNSTARKLLLRHGGGYFFIAAYSNNTSIDVSYCTTAGNPRGTYVSISNCRGAVGIDSSGNFYSCNNYSIRRINAPITSTGNITTNGVFLDLTPGITNSVTSTIPEISTNGVAIGWLYNWSENISNGHYSAYVSGLHSTTNRMPRVDKNDTSGTVIIALSANNLLRTTDGINYTLIRIPPTVYSSLPTALNSVTTTHGPTEYSIASDNNGTWAFTSNNRIMVVSTDDGITWQGRDIGVNISQIGPVVSNKTAGGFAFISNNSPNIFETNNGWTTVLNTRSLLNSNTSTIACGGGGFYFYFTVSSGIARVYRRTYNQVATEILRSSSASNSSTYNILDNMEGAIYKNGSIYSIYGSGITGIVFGSNIATILRPSSSSTLVSTQNTIQFGDFSIFTTGMTGNASATNNKIRLFGGEEVTNFDASTTTKYVKVT